MLAVPLAGTMALLGSSSTLPAADWYTRYQHTDTGLVANFDFNAIEVGQIRDEVSRKTLMSFATPPSVSGHKKSQS